MQIAVHFYMNKCVSYYDAEFYKVSSTKFKIYNTTTSLLEKLIGTN